MLPPVEKILSDLIKLNSENPPGREMEVAQYLRDLFASFRIPGEIIESAPGRASFIARVGSGERCLLLLSHTDVVPAGKGWDFAPFSGEIRDSLVLGRGALDCKGLVAEEAYATLYLAQKSELKGRLIFAATADEESGSAFGVRYLLEHCPEKLRADFAVNEGGEEPIEINGKRVYFVQAGEKGTAWSRLRTRGVSAHGSLPTLGDNAVIKMADAIARLSRYPPEPKLVPEVRRMLQALVELKGLDWPVDEPHIDPIIQSFMEDRAFAAYLSALTRMTVSPNAISGGTKTNIVPDSCEADLDIRILPGQDRQYVLAEMARIIGSEPEIQMVNYSPPTFSPTDGAPFRLLCETAQEVVGDAVCLPCLSAGATDSRFLRGVGIPSYGISVSAPGADPEQKKTVHGRNERVDMATLHLEAQFLIRLAQRYLSAGGISNK